MREPRKLDALDYLIKHEPAAKHAPPARQAPAVSESGMEAFVAGEILQALDGLGAAQEAVRLSSVGQKLGMSAEILVPLVRRLTAAGLVEVQEEDAFGNHLVRLTPAGAELRNTGPDEMRDRIAG